MANPEMNSEHDFLAIQAETDVINRLLAFGREAEGRRFSPKPRSATLLGFSYAENPEPTIYASTSPDRVYKVRDEKSFKERQKAALARKAGIEWDICDVNAVNISLRLDPGESTRAIVHPSSLVKNIGVQVTKVFRGERKTAEYWHAIDRTERFRKPNI